jgi:hypothetical protein
MRGLSAAAALLTIVAALPAVAYEQADVDACMPDAMRLCTEAMPDEGRVTLCLVKNKALLGPACTAVFERSPIVNAGRENVPRERPTKIRPTKF